MTEPAPKPNNPEGPPMETSTDTTTMKDKFDTLRTMVGSTLIQSASAVQALLDIDAAFKADDIDKARLLANNWSSEFKGQGAESINWLVYQALPRGGDKPDGGMG